ncbi:MAG: hypothetical protein IKA31_04720 [Clostridia bacterium]|nr:hypothetical protein [Clostridia bacterium]MBR3890134.1 hypothetical protein [bacterium]
MNRDVIYLFDKLTNHGIAFGEIQSDFNMSNVIDGTKDSMRVQVWSFVENEIEPYSIIFHKKTMTWWIVSHDKVERYKNDVGFYYVHNIDLLGAIELFNARDLTDCGFNSNKYTIRSFIDRLVKLSNFEFKDNFVLETNANIYLDQVVDFVKTFENYTLLSALREFLDAYNCAAKLDFDFDKDGNTLTLIKAYINIISKTGSQDTPIDIDSFDDARETKTLDKNSFGTCVVSNAENVISNVSKTFPSSGSVKLSSTQGLIVKGVRIKDLVIRLPSKVYKGNWIKIVFPLQVTLYVQGTTTHTFNYTYNGTQYDYEKLMEYFAQKIIDDTGEQDIANTFLSYDSEELKSNMDLAKVVTLYDGNKIVPYYGNSNNDTGKIIIEKGNNIPYLAKLNFNGTEKNAIFTDKNTKECLDDNKQGIAWERGSNLITGFDMFDGADTLQTMSRDYNGGNFIEFSESGITIKMYASSQQTLKDVYTGSPSLANQLKNISFIVNYIPMSDMKIKVDNQRNKRDIQLYNQNGKLTDNFALSKLINSYSKEISSDNITRYMQYYNYNNVPKVGQLVYKELENGTNEYYVINNISINFSQNETNGIEYDYVYHHTLYTLYDVEDNTLCIDGTISGTTITLDTAHTTNDTFNYMCECEITMSKSIAAKSLMVNPNTNIRDYGIPQNFNVKRKQVYRDYYELAYEVYDDANENDPYFPTENMFALSETPNIFADLSCVIKVTYNELINGNNTYYYQLETTNYYLNKMLYVMLDFNDNNIIGYGSQNVYSGFVIKRIFDGLTDTLNTPISYVDTKGETNGISIYYCTNEQLTTIYAEYQDEQGYGSNTDVSLYNYSVFIPKDIYDKAANSHKIFINESQYNKDALEVPVFEYACQVDDSEDVLIGDNILFQYDSNHIYFYHYIVGDNLTQNNVYDTKRIEPRVSPTGFAMYDCVKINRSSLLGGGYELLVYLYESAQYNVENDICNYGAEDTFADGKDYAVFRHALDLTTGEEKIDLMFIAKKVKTNQQIPNLLEIKINHYKL